jgi:putative hydrolase of the HAD superfamily
MALMPRAFPLPPAVRAVFFDAVGTLIHPDPPAAEVYARVGRSLGSRLDAAEVVVRFSAAFGRQEAIDRAYGWSTNEEREVTRWRAIVGEVLDDVSDNEACFDALYTHFSRPEAWRCDPDAAATLAGLEAGGFILGLASNFDSRLKGVAAGLPALRPLRHRVISSLVGWRKPARQFFRRLGEDSGLGPGQILYVGDDFGNDYLGARDAGLHVLLLDPRGKEPIPGGARLHRLGDLLGP